MLLITILLNLKILFSFENINIESFNTSSNFEFIDENNQCGTDIIVKDKFYNITNSNVKSFFTDDLNEISIVCNHCYNGMFLTNENSTSFYSLIPKNNNYGSYEAVLECLSLIRDIDNNLKSNNPYLISIKNDTYKSKLKYFDAYLTGYIYTDNESFEINTKNIIEIEELIKIFEPIKNKYKNLLPTKINKEEEILFTYFLKNLDEYLNNLINDFKTCSNNFSCSKVLLNNIEKFKTVFIDTDKNNYNEFIENMYFSLKDTSNINYDAEKFFSNFSEYQIEKYKNESLLKSSLFEQKKENFFDVKNKKKDIAFSQNVFNKCSEIFNSDDNLNNIYKSRVDEFNNNLDIEKNIIDDDYYQKLSSFYNADEYQKRINLKKVCRELSNNVLQRALRQKEINQNLKIKNIDDATIIANFLNESFETLNSLCIPISETTKLISNYIDNNRIKELHNLNITTRPRTGTQYGFEEAANRENYGNQRILDKINEVKKEIDAELYLYENKIGEYDTDLIPDVLIAKALFYSLFQERNIEHLKNPFLRLFASTKFREVIGYYKITESTMATFKDACMLKGTPFSNTNLSATDILEAEAEIEVNNNNDIEQANKNILDCGGIVNINGSIKFKNNDFDNYIKYSEKNPNIPYDEFIEKENIYKPSNNKLIKIISNYSVSHPLAVIDFLKNNDEYLSSFLLCTSLFNTFKKEEAKQLYIQMFYNTALITSTALTVGSLGMFGPATTGAMVLLNKTIFWLSIGTSAVLSIHKIVELDKRMSEVANALSSNSIENDNGYIIHYYDKVSQSTQKLWLTLDVALAFFIGKITLKNLKTQNITLEEKILNLENEISSNSKNISNFSKAFDLSVQKVKVYKTCYPINKGINPVDPKTSTYFSSFDEKTQKFLIKVYEERNKLPYQNIEESIAKKQRYYRGKILYDELEKNKISHEVLNTNQKHNNSKLDKLKGADVPSPIINNPIKKGFWKRILTGSDDSVVRYVSLEDVKLPKQINNIKRKPLGYYIETAKNLSKQMRLCKSLHKNSGINITNTALLTGLTEAGINSAFKTLAYYNWNLTELRRFKNFGEIKTDIISGAAASFINSTIGVKFQSNFQNQLYTSKWFLEAVKTPQYGFLTGSGFLEFSSSALLYNHSAYSELKYGNKKDEIAIARFAYANAYNSVFSIFAKMGVYNAISGLACLFPSGSISVMANIGLQFSFRGFKELTFYFIRGEVLDSLGLTIPDPPSLEELERIAEKYKDELVLPNNEDIELFPSTTRSTNDDRNAFVRDKIIY